MTEPLPLSVWPVAQRTSRAQRTGRYVTDSVAHPAKMLPALASTAIKAYTAPGDVVLDPMCGIGTTLVEAAHLGRDAVGVEYEPRWAQLAGRNLAHAREHGAAGSGRVLAGDARDLASLLDRALLGRVALVLTSPPYGASVHGVVTADPRHGVGKRNDRYSRDPANLAHQRPDALLEAFAAILAACTRYLRPGGVVAVTARPWRRDGVLVDFPTAVAAVAEQAGLVPFERNVALLAALRDDRLVPRSSFFQLRPGPQGPRPRRPAARHRPRRRARVPQAGVSASGNRRNASRRAGPELRHRPASPGVTVHAPRLVPLDDRNRGRAVAALRALLIAHQAREDTAGTVDREP